MTPHTRAFTLALAADGHGQAIAHAIADALIAEGLLDKDKRITDAGRAELARLKGGAR